MGESSHSGTPRIDRDYQSGGTALLGPHARLCRSRAAWRPEDSRMADGSLGVGALAGALLLASRKSLTGLGKWVPLSAGAFAAALVAFAFSRAVWLSMLTLVVIGFTMMIEMGASNTLIQSMAPDRLRGRVMSVYSMMFMGMAPLGALLAGAAAEHVGAPWTVAAGAAICLAASVVFAFSETSVR